MSKDTGKIIEELGLYEDFRSFYSENENYMIRGTLSDFLEEKLLEK